MTYVTETVGMPIHINGADFIIRGDGIGNKPSTVDLLKSVPATELPLQ